MANPVYSPLDRDAQLAEVLLHDTQGALCLTEGAGVLGLLSGW